jgi:hypothetical protein
MLDKFADGLAEKACSSFDGVNHDGDIGYWRMELNFIWHLAEKAGSTVFDAAADI